MIRERHEQEHERRLAELRATEERGKKLLQLKEAEKEKRAKEMRERETSRRSAVEERRRQMEMSENDKRRQILAKYDVAGAIDDSTTTASKVMSSSIMTSSTYGASPRSKLQQNNNGGNSNFVRNHPNRSTYAFGSSTPRTLAYLENLDPTMKLYNTRLQSSDHHNKYDHNDDTSLSMSTSVCSQRTNVSGYGRRSLGPSTTVNPTAARPTPDYAHIANNDAVNGGELASPSDLSYASTSMTTSFALGDSPSLSPVRNVRRQNLFTSIYGRGRDHFASRASHVRSSLRNTKETEKRIPPTTAATAKKPVHERSGGGIATLASSTVVVKENKQQKQQPANQQQQQTKSQIIRKTKTVNVNNNNDNHGKKETTKNNATFTTKLSALTMKKSASANAAPKEENVATAAVEEIRNFERTPSPTHEASRFADENVEVSMNSTTLTANFLNDNVFGGNLPNDNETTTMTTVDERKVEVHNDDNTTTTDVDADVIIPSSNNDNILTNVPTPTGKSLAGQALTKEEAKAALTERRRLAREQIEREKEFERQREEQRRLDEEEMLRKEEEEFRRQEEEERRILEAARKADEERLQLAIEEQRRRRVEEELAMEEEKRRVFEQETRTRETLERAEREREEKLRKEEEERVERKKKLDAIMLRTRQSNAGDANNGSDVSSADESTPSKNVAGTSSLAKSFGKLTDDVGRSVGSILNRVRSTTKGDKSLLSSTEKQEESLTNNNFTSTTTTSATFSCLPENPSDDVNEKSIHPDNNLLVFSDDNSNNGFLINGVDLMDNNVNNSCSSSSSQQHQRSAVYVNGNNNDEHNNGGDIVSSNGGIDVGDIIINQRGDVMNNNNANSAAEHDNITNTTYSVVDSSLTNGSVSTKSVVTSADGNGVVVLGNVYH